jgi:hypothetical protein
LSLNREEKYVFIKSTFLFKNGHKSEKSASDTLSEALFFLQRAAAEVYIKLFND